MRPFGTDPQQFIVDFFTSFHDDLVRDDEDPALIFDRYHTPDVVQVADGHRMDRDKLIAHTRPVRKNKPSNRVEVHEAHASEDRIAARYTLHVQNRKLRQAHMLTRTLSTNDTPESSGSETGQVVASA